MPLRRYTPTPPQPQPQPQPAPPVVPPAVTSEEKIELVELFGQVPGIDAGKYGVLIEYEVPEGFCAEVVGIGVVPDWNTATLVSNLWHIKVARNSEEFWPPGDFKALARRYLNVFSYGSSAYKKPIFTFDRPYTLKFNTKDVIQLRGYADPNNAAEQVTARMQVILYNEAAALRLFGARINSFATLPGGHMQSPIKRFQVFDGVILDTPTSGKSKWENVYDRELKNYETFKVTHVGVWSNSDNAWQLRLYDERTREPIPHREEYAWVVSMSFNMLPFGDAEDDLGMAQLDEKFQREYTFTTLEAQLKDSGTPVPAGSFAVQLKGIYTYRGV